MKCEHCHHCHKQPDIRMEQHMTTTDHPLTEARAAEIWNTYREPGVAPFHALGRIYGLNQIAMLRAAFDVGREHERAQARPAEVTDEMVKAGHAAALGRSMGDPATYRRVIAAALAVTSPTDQYHDPRPWQDCTLKDIHKGDMVEAKNYDRLHIGVVHDQNGHGDWCTEDGWPLTWGDRWPLLRLRRIPAPTEKEAPMTETTPATSAEPTARTLLGVPEGHGAPHHDVTSIRAGDYVVQVDKDGYARGGIAHYQDDDGDQFDEDGQSLTWAAKRSARPDAVTVWPAPAAPAFEVELPTEHPAHITDVWDRGGDVCAYMALDNEGDWLGVDQDGDDRRWVSHSITAFTLPDGTRARRDGTHADGTPRFVKVGDQ